MYYYAHINSSNLVDAVYVFSTPTTEDGYIEITEAQYNLPITTYRYHPDSNYFEEWYWACSTDEVCYPNSLDMVTTILDDFTDEFNGKADINHSHSDYAASSHTHTEYAPLSHSHSNYATTTHSHSYNDLSDKPTIPSAYTHPASHPASMITGLSDVATSGSYNDLTNKPTIPSAYTHPSYTAKSSGLYKVTVDATGHVSAATAVTKADITALGIPASDTNTTYSAATTSSAGLMSASDKSKLDTSAGKIIADTTCAETFNDYTNNIASGDYSHAEGRITEASGGYSHAEGQYTTASGMYSHAEGQSTTSSGMYSHAEGQNTTSSGMYSHTEGCGVAATGECSHAEGYYTTAKSYQHVLGHYNNTSTSGGVNSGTTTGSAFVIGNGTYSSGSNAFRVTYAGKPYSCSSMTTSGADYAEFFEWQDSNSDGEDRRGYFVTLDDDKIRIAEPNDYILGIVSALPAVIGNGDEDWRGRYILDEFGAFIVEEFEYESEVFDEETGAIKVITQTGTRYKENPDYDHSIPYIQREDRPEWDTVGMMGVLAVRDDGTCQVNGYCKVAEGGIATTADSGYRVITRVNNHVVKIVFR